MKHKLTAITSITVLICMVLCNMVGCAPVAAAEYDLTIDSTAGGSVTMPGEGGFIYDEGTVVYLEAEAQEGYYFVNWSGDVSTIANVSVPTTIITMNGDYQITANFEQIPLGHFALTITSVAGGLVTIPGEGAFICSPGMVVVLEAEADEGYRFTSWTGDVGTIGNVTAAATTITINDNYSITANFVALYDLTIASTEGGSVTDPGEGVFICDEGTVVELVVEAALGYQFGNWTGDVVTIADVYSASTTITMSGDYSITASFQYIPMVAAGCHHTVGLKTDGTVVAVGHNGRGQCDVGGWTDIIQVAASAGEHTVGLKSDGTVVAVGQNASGECDVGGWTDVVQVATGWSHTVGLETGGTVVAVGHDYYGQCDVGGWTDITQVSASCVHTVGLKTDGSVVAVGNNEYGQCDVGGWTNITQVAAGGWAQPTPGGESHTAGLRNDGTVVVVGDNGYGQCNVDGWTDITQVAAGMSHTVGLRSDGTVVAVGRNTYGQCNVGGWTDIIQVATSYMHTVGLKADGTVVAVGYNSYGQLAVGGWDLIP